MNFSGKHKLMQVSSYFEWLYESFRETYAFFSISFWM